MNLLELDIKEKHIGKNKEYWLNLKIDGDEFLNRINSNLNIAVFDELERSLIEDNAYLIFTCSCGIADCGGWKKVQVNHIDKKIIWKFRYGVSDYFFEFDALFYIGEVERMRFELNNKKLKLQPEFIMPPE